MFKIVHEFHESTLVSKGIRTMGGNFPRGQLSLNRSKYTSESLQETRLLTKLKNALPDLVTFA